MILKTIIDRLNQRVEVSNIFDRLYGLCELTGENGWVNYIGNGEAIPVTNYDAKVGTLFWARRGKVNISKIDSLRVSGCKQMYSTKFNLSAFAVVKKNHVPCDAEDAADWIASRVYKLVSGRDYGFKEVIDVVSYEVIPVGYTVGDKTLPENLHYATVVIELLVEIVSGSEDTCYDICDTGDIPLPPDFLPCNPCLTEVAVDGVTIGGNGTEADPLYAIGGGGGGSLIVKDDGTNVSTNTTTLNFTGAGVTASLTSPGVVEVNIPSGGGGGEDLQQTTDIGNTTTNDIAFIGDTQGLLFDNGSRVRKGTTDAGLGGSKGTAQICSISYELKWEAGRLYYMEQDGFTIRDVTHNFNNIPQITDDASKGFVVGSRWGLDDGSVYVCTDNTNGAAVWAVQSTSVGNLQDVTDVGNTTTNDLIVQGANDFVGQVSSQSISAFNTVTGAYAEMFVSTSGQLSLSDGTSAGILTINNLTNTNVQLEFPNKTTGTYTIATTADIPNTIVEDVTASAPLASSGGNTPDISITQATTVSDGYLSATDFNTFDGKQDALTAGTGIDLTGNIVTNTAPDQTVTLTAGTGISTSGTYPSFTIDNTAPDQIVSLTAGTDINISGSYPNFTIASTAAAGGMQGGTASGTDTYTVTIPGVTAYNTNDAYAIGFTNANTGASTLNVNGLGAVNISKNNVVPIIGGDIAANQQFIAIYDGTNFQILGVAPNQMFAYITNADSVTINRGQPVYAFGATGDRMTVKLANNTSEATSSKTVGLVFSSSIAPNQKGYIITQGVIDGINTNAYTAGDTLYVGNTAGGLTNVLPLAPNHLTRIGIVERANAGNGQIYVFVQNGFQLDELSDVDITTTPLANNQFLVYTTGVNNLWKNRTLGNVLGGTTSQYVRGDGSLATFPTIPTGTVTSVGLTMPAAFSVANSPVTTSGTLAVTGAGTTAEYIRGDGTLATFPTIPAASVVYKSAISSATHTGTANTVKYTQLIPANTFVAGDVVRITYRTAKTGTANSMTLRIYANTTPDLSGSPILLGSHQNAGAPSFLVNQMIRHLAIKTANNNTEVYFAPGLGVATDYGLYDLTSTAAVNWTQQQYIVFALQLNTTGADVTFGSFYMIEKP